MRNRRKFSVELPDSLTKEQSIQLNHLTTLNDQAFDQQYIIMMTVDHAKTIKFFQEAANLSDVDLTAFAAKKIPIIDAHYKMALAIGKKLNLKNANNGDDLSGESPAPGHTN